MSVLTASPDHCPSLSELSTRKSDSANAAASTRPAQAREHVAVPAQHGVRVHHQVQALERVPREPVQQRR